MAIDLPIGEPPPSAFGDSLRAVALQPKGNVIKVTLRGRLCQVVSHCLAPRLPTEILE